MQWHGIKIHVVVLSVVAALAAFLGTQWLYNSLNFREPLKKELEANSQVLDYRIEETETGSYLVYVSIGKTRNLMTSYRQVYEAVEQVMGNRRFDIELTDNRNELLTGVYDRGQFAIHEALVQGNFREMAASLNQEARQAGAGSDVFIDGRNIYWQMSHGDSYLYAVIPRQLPPGTPTGEYAVERR